MQSSAPCALVQPFQSAKCGNAKRRDAVLTLGNITCLSTLEDNDLFFRASPSDARQGQVIAELLQEKGIKSIAMTYTNNDYGKGLADAIQSNYEATGGKVTINTAHEDGKGDYGAEVAALAQAGGDILVVVGYLDQGGKGIIQSSLDAGAFSDFFLPDAMIGESLVKAIGPDLDGSIGTVPGTDSKGAEIYAELAKKDGFTAGPYSPEAYDAAALTCWRCKPQIQPTATL